MSQEKVDARCRFVTTADATVDRILLCITAGRSDEEIQVAANEVAKLVHTLGRRADEDAKVIAEAYDAGVEAASDALEVLYKAALAVEWVGPDYRPVEGPLQTGRHSCPSCRHSVSAEGSPVHDPGCKLWDALRLAQSVLAFAHPDRFRFEVAGKTS